MTEENFETKTVVELDAAVYLARKLLHDMQYGYSIDDLVAEAYSFMKAEAFTAVEVKDDAESNLYAAASEMYTLLKMIADPTTFMGTQTCEELRTAIEAVLKKARGEA